MATSEQPPRRSAARIGPLRFAGWRKRRHRRGGRPFANDLAFIAMSGSLALILLHHQPVRTQNTTTPAPSTAISNAAQEAPDAPATRGILPSPAAGSPSRTVLGAVVNTDFGPMQVQVSLTNGQITSTRAIRVTNAGFTSQRINERSLPVLNTEAVRTQSAAIDSVSGATVTSNGYKQSLQSAIDMARHI
jgi:uncharacterized protein with FMN-binding domain